MKFQHRCRLSNSNVMTQLKSFYTKELKKSNTMFSKTDQNFSLKQQLHFETRPFCTKPVCKPSENHISNINLTNASVFVINPKSDFFDCLQLASKRQMEELNVFFERNLTEKKKAINVRVLSNTRAFESFKNLINSNCNL